jgi:hypothetical protein
LGSKLVALNDTMVLNRPYLDTLEMVKTLPRPLKVVMEKVEDSTAIISTNIYICIYLPTPNTHIHAKRFA